jgi:hypothetical protein
MVRSQGAVLFVYPQVRPRGFAAPALPRPVALARCLASPAPAQLPVCEPSSTGCTCACLTLPGLHQRLHAPGQRLQGGRRRPLRKGGPQRAPPRPALRPPHNPSAQLPAQLGSLTSSHHGASQPRAPPVSRSLHQPLSPAARPAPPWPQGYAVFGLSADPPEVQAGWKKEHGLTYPLLSDPSK